MLGSANRDERHFEDPDALDLSRDLNRHVAFGRGGVHRATLIFRREDGEWKAVHRHGDNAVEKTPPG